MCGICGTAGFAEVGQLQAMNHAILHRGPDDGGIHIVRNAEGTPWVGLTNRRLSIIDLSAAGHQPMSNEDGRVWITYNGELFNFLDLRPYLETKGHTFRSRTDTEVLVHLYEERGLDFLSALNGMFALALWDATEQRLLLARDPFGIKPLYYLPLADGKLAFASEVKSLLAGGLLKPEVDPEAMHHFLNFLWVPGPKTLFKGVFKLMPGHHLVWRDGRFDVRKYWNGIPTVSPSTRSEPELVEELRALLHASVRRHLVSDVPLGVFLSGGLDSSSLLALGSLISNRSMKAFTITFRPEDALYEQSDEDPGYARLVARTFGAQHHEIEVSPDIVTLLPKIVWHLDEPVADPAAITSYLICEAARNDLTVLLSGQGGDEIFGGYRVHLADRLSRPLELLPRLVREKGLLPLVDTLPLIRDKIPGVRPGKIMAFHRYFGKILRGADYSRAFRYVFHRSYYAPGELTDLYAAEFATNASEFDAYPSHLTYFKDVGTSDFIDQMLYVDQKTFLPDLNLTYSDKTSMAASVEVRLPLLDQQIASFMRGVPARTKIRRIKQKYLFKKAMEGVLPKEVIWRGKAGFGAPIRTWLRGSLREMTLDLLSESTIRDRGFFDPHAVHRMIADDAEGTADHAYRIWALLTLEVWQRTFTADLSRSIASLDRIGASVASDPMCGK